MAFNRSAKSICYKLKPSDDSFETFFANFFKSEGFFFNSEKFENYSKTLLIVVQTYFSMKVTRSNIQNILCPVSHICSKRNY